MSASPIETYRGVAIYEEHSYRAGSGATPAKPGSYRATIGEVVRRGSLAEVKEHIDDGADGVGRAGRRY